MSRAQGGPRSSAATPVCLEIAGPAGAGKTSLVTELLGRCPRVRLRHPPDWHEPRQFMFFVRNGLLLMPSWAVFILGGHGKRLKRKELFSMTFLNGWHRRLAGGSPDGGITVFDQGPVYMLSELYYFRGEQAARLLARPKWKRTRESWAHVLKAVVWLDAADDVLIRRINAREKDHLIRGASLSSSLDFLGRSRAALNRAMDALTKMPGAPAVVRLDTGRLSLEETVDRVCREFELDAADAPGFRS